MSNHDYERVKQEKEAIEEFLTSYFPPSIDSDAGLFEDSLSTNEQKEIDALVEEVDENFDGFKGILGLALDFLMVAEGISQHDGRVADFEPDLEFSDIFERYEQASTAATLTLRVDSERFGIRSVHEEVTDLFREDLRRTNFPSAAPHYTGEWRRFEEMLVISFRLSRRGRYEAGQRLFNLGLRRLEAKSFLTRDPPFPDVFKRVWADYERADPDEEAGSAYQALAYGYVEAEWPHLSLRASKLRTGSSRQNRYGDIDGYYGPDLMISVEVKDKTIDKSNVQAELGIMMELAENTTAIAIALCKAITDPAENTLEESGVECLTDDDIQSELTTWDYHKQNRALQGAIHYLTNVEENPKATQRLLQYVSKVDPDNRALDHLIEED